MSVRSSSGSRGSAAAAAAAFSTSSGNSGETFISAWIAAMPSRRVCAATPSSVERTRTTLLAMSATLVRVRAAGCGSLA